MSKRRITKQQSKRIASKQNAYHLEKPDQSLLLDGLVISRYSKHAEIEDAAGLRVHCSIRPNIDSLVAGDRVIWQGEGEGQGVVLSRYPRQSVLSKQNSRGQEKPIAANITQVIIVVAPKPEISWPLLDSYLIMTTALHLKPVILLNKIDLPSDAIKERLIHDYQPLGYPLLFVSKEQTDSYQQLDNILNEEVSVFVGQSGVGKSSLIAAVLPHETGIETQEISENAQLGKHTTSNSRYYHLTCGGALIDSPGVREFNLDHLDAMTILQGYPEFKPFLSNCKFRNCNHIDDLGCGIVTGVQEGKLSALRYENFVKLCQQYLNR